MILSPKLSPMRYKMAINYKDYKPTKHSGLFIHLTDPYRFWFVATIDGKRFRKTYNTERSHTKADALKKAYDAMQSFLRTKSEEMNIIVAIDSTVNQYFDILRANKDNSGEWNKERVYRNGLFYDKYIRNEFGKKAIRSVTGSDFTRLNTTLAHLAVRSRKVAYELLVPVFNLAIEDDLIKTSPIKKSHIPKRNQLSEKKVVTDAVTKYRAVHKAILQAFSENPHHRALFLFGFHGRRLSEVTSLQWSDIDFNNNRYIIRGEYSKVDTDMMFTLPNDIAEALSHFRDSTGDVFTVKSVNTQYQKIREITGINEFTFHWMRNLAVSALSSMGVEATHLSAMLGHTDAGTLRKYLSLQREQSTSATLQASQILLGGTN